jgi:CheY-like chemotaxis protein
MTPEPLNTLADQGMLEQVVMNMAVNARDAMPRGGRLTITTAAIVVDEEHQRRHPLATPGDYVRLSVSDTGGGIPDDVLPQIFEPFFTTKESGKGTGLGLAISLGIVQQHRGWIEVETRRGEGTTFHVYLPRHASSAPAELPPRRSVRPACGNATILVVEDEEAVRALVQAVLVRHGYRVIEASSGAEALNRWQERRDEIDVLLTDIVMPGAIDGHELAAQLTREKPDLRAITMSGYDPSEVASQELGTPQLRKPFSADELLAAVKSACPS